jgi:hypothetical protein
MDDPPATVLGAHGGPRPAIGREPHRIPAPKHDWWDWYAAYMNARQQGRTPEQASSEAALYMEAMVKQGASG